MNFKHISQLKVCNQTFQKLDLESQKLLLNFNLSLIWKILELGAKVLSRIRSPQKVLNKNLSFYKVCLLSKLVPSSFKITAFCKDEYAGRLCKEEMRETR